MSSLGIALDLQPLEARSVDELPTGEGWQFEPKWDGFRCLAFRAGDEIELRAKSGKSLTRFFPDAVSNLRAIAPKFFVLDGELVIAIDHQPSFDALQMRLHPSAKRIARLAADTPATFMAFDCLLRTRSRPLLAKPLSARRDELEAFFALVGDGADGLHLTPATLDRRTARSWLNGRAVETDGVIAKRIELPYQPGERAMLKIKRQRTADCVIGGFRYESNSRRVGSLLLGLYDNEGLLHHVGFTSAIADRDKPALTHKLEKLVAAPGFTGDAPGGPSRWSTDRSAEWTPLKPKLVVEVRYDHVTGKRFRHGTKLLRWRPDKAPRQCTFAQFGR